MADWNDSGVAPGGRVSAPVKLYDAARGYGFLAPGGGLPDIFCHASALRKVGLDALIEGATVICETVHGERGPQVARILAVDFSTASPARGEAAPAAGPASGDPVRAVVKWYVPAKGYGFLAPEDGSADLFCRAAVVQASGRDFLPQGFLCESGAAGRSGVLGRFLGAGRLRWRRVCRRGWPIVWPRRRFWRPIGCQAPTSRLARRKL